MFKTQAGPQAAGEWFHSYEYRPWKIVNLFSIKYYNIDNFIWSISNCTCHNEKIIFGHYQVISMAYTLIDHSS